MTLMALGKSLKDQPDDVHDKSVLDERALLQMTINAGVQET